MKLQDLLEGPKDLKTNVRKLFAKIAYSTGMVDVCGGRTDVITGMIGTHKAITIKVGLLFQGEGGDSSPEKIKTAFPKFLKAMFQEFDPVTLEISTMVHTKDVAYNDVKSPDYDINKIFPKTLDLSATFAMHINVIGYDAKKISKTLH